MSDGTWIGWFLNLQVNDFLCRVPHDFLGDRFNLTGLETLVPNFHSALDAILDREFDTEYGFNQTEVDTETSAQLYGHIHARYIMSARGIGDMCVKYQRGDFGFCPRIYCDGQLMLPVGLTDSFGEAHVKVYCPRCRDVYQPHDRCALLDGAMFGRSFPHMFFMQMPELLPEPPIEKYTPRSVRRPNTRISLSLSPLLSYLPSLSSSAFTASSCMNRHCFPYRRRPAPRAATTIQYASRISRLQRKRIRFTHNLTSQQMPPIVLKTTHFISYRY